MVLNPDLFFFENAVDPDQPAFNRIHTRDGYRQKNRIAIYHDTGPAYRDTYHDTYYKI